MSNRLKSALRPLVPSPILAQWQRYRFNVEQAQARGRPLADVFNEIYARGVWRPDGQGAVYHSGPGSLPDVSKGYEAFVAGYINADTSIERIVDIGCGDFQVAQRILARLNRPVAYVGCDIASLVVEDNTRRHAVPGRISFQQLDVSRDTLPAGEIVSIREVFQHLSNDTIRAALANLRTTFKRAIITEAVPKVPSAPNLDIVSGYRTRDGLNSGVFLDLAPFNLEVVASYEMDVAHESLRTLIVDL